MAPKPSSEPRANQKSRMVAANDLSPDDEIMVLGERKQIIAVQVI